MTRAPSTLGWPPPLLLRDARRNTRRLQAPATLAPVEPLPRGPAVPYELALQHLALLQVTLDGVAVSPGVLADYGLPEWSTDGRHLQVVVDGLARDRWLQRHGWRRFVVVDARHRAARTLASNGWLQVAGGPTGGTFRLEVLPDSCPAPRTGPALSRWYWRGMLDAHGESSPSLDTAAALLPVDGRCACGRLLPAGERCASVTALGLHRGVGVPQDELDGVWSAPPAPEWPIGQPRRPASALPW